MNYELSPGEIEFKKKFREFCQKEILPRAFQVDATASFSWDNYRRLAKEGFFGLLFPTPYGGTQKPFLTSVIAWEELACACPSTFLSAVLGSILAATTIFRYGKEEQKRNYLPGLIQGEKLGVFALTEPQGGSDIAALKTTAQKDMSSYVLNGTKAFAINGPLADITILFALTDPSADQQKKMAVFIIEKGTAGFLAGPPLDKLGARGAPVSDLTLQNCRIPETQMLAIPGEGLSVARTMKEISRLGYAAYSMGIAQAALEEAVQYARKRQAFGRPIAHFQEISFKVADMQMYVDTGRLLLYHAAWMLDEGMEAGTDISIAKLFTSEAATWCATTAVQIHGGYGYLKGYRVEQLYRDAKLGEIGEATSEMQRRAIARSLLGEGY
jgi:alkylation response protein AidB-like acyl-CoA dehydrogenase